MKNWRNVVLLKRIVPLIAPMVASAAILAGCANDPSPAPTTSSSGSPAAGVPVSLVSGTAKSNKAQPDTGDWAVPNGGPAVPAAQKWVSLVASSAGNLDPVVVNGAGLTLYRFNKDTAKPSKSNCDGACAEKWPPLTVAANSKVFLAGIKRSAVGFVQRTDGTYQVTIGGWPVYRFAKDTKRGDTLGQGVDGTWFGVTPDGQRAGAPGGGSPTASASEDPAQAPATSAVLFDDANFSDNGPSQGVAGSGCQNVARPAVTSSITAEGSLKLWTGENCTGRSTVINGDVAKLSTIGFDNAIKSVFFG